MKSFVMAVAVFLFTSAAVAQTNLTIYNQNFAVVKEDRVFKLRKGENEARLTEITRHLEPESVMLRDLSFPDSIQILEQNYESQPLSEGLLLSKLEGKEIEFEVFNPETKKKEIKKGILIRSGYVPHTQAYGRFGQQYARTQRLHAYPSSNQPIVLMDGKIRFGLPGKPTFAELDPEAFLKPTLLWKLWSGRKGKHKCELSYITGGMSWEATYNILFPEEGDRFDLIGWVTMDNQSGLEFKEAKIKLMAGDVSKLKPGEERKVKAMFGVRAMEEAGPAVTEKAFEEYHLYTLQRSTTLRDREIKQVEFVRAHGAKGKKLYVYDGVRFSSRYRHWDWSSRRTQGEYGTECNPKIWVMLEFKNSKENNLGIALPRGVMKLYRQDEDKRNEFIGEDIIDHTPRDETVRLYTGNAFDIVGERRQTNFKVDTSRRMCDEWFEIKLRNRKDKTVEVRVVEHLYRWFTWEIVEKSNAFLKTDARTIEFRIQLPPDEEKTITYHVQYTW